MARKSAVRSQMPSGGVGSMTPAPGSFDKCDPPFDKPHDTGNGGIPLKFYERHGGQGAARLSSIKKQGPPTPALSAPSAQGPTRPITRVSAPKNNK